MENMNFEEALKKLETIANELETSNLSLDDSFQKFKEGMDLSALCAKMLDDVEKKITVLVEEDKDTYTEKIFQISAGEENE